MNYCFDSKRITEMAKSLFAEKRAGKRLDGWFIAKEAELELANESFNEDMDSDGQITLGI